MQRFEVALDGSTVAQGMDIWEPPRPHPSHCASMQCFSDLVRARADSRRTVVLAMTKCASDEPLRLSPNPSLSRRHPDSCHLPQRWLCAILA